MLTTDVLNPAQLRQLGWDLKPEGLCRGDRCVPLPGHLDTSSGELPTEVVAERLGMPLLIDDVTGQHALGPEVGQPAITSSSLPSLDLADLDGNPFNLDALQGRKNLLVAWASW